MTHLLFSRTRTVTRRKNRLYLITHELLRQEVERERENPTYQMPYWLRDG
jgi:hypothetical protein